MHADGPPSSRLGRLSIRRSIEAWAASINPSACASRELAPDGVAAVFDHIGGPGLLDSWRMLARGATLVCYGTASTLDQPGNPRLPVARLLARLFAWNVLPRAPCATPRPAASPARSCSSPRTRSASGGVDHHR